MPPPPESFDGETIRCQVGGSAVAVLICRDPELSDLDELLCKMLRQLLSDASRNHTTREALVDDQRRWVATLDGCWKAGESMRACVKTNQQQRLQPLCS